MRPDPTHTLPKLHASLSLDANYASPGELIAAQPTVSLQPPLADARALNPEQAGEQSYQSRTARPTASHWAVRLDRFSAWLQPRLLHRDLRQLLCQLQVPAINQTRLRSFQHMTCYSHWEELV